jgi:alcohol dehydrogenase class IV
MMNFSFLAPRVIVERGYAGRVGGLCAKLRKRACIFRYGERFFASGNYDRIKKSLDENGVESAVFRHVTGEPSPAVIDDAADFMRREGCDGALAVGGGSVIDAAKAACAIAPNEGGVMDYLEGFSPRAFEEKPLPLIAMPTTAGTGSECTKNAVITSKGNFKNSVRDDDMLPACAVIDAELMMDVPGEVTAAAGADCICQLVECYVSRLANPVADAIALGFMKTAFHALPAAYDDGRNVEVREEMGVAACACGMAMTNSGLGMAHGLAAGLGALTPLSHGLICGVLLPHVMRFNIGKGILKYADIARALTGQAYGSEARAAEDAVRSVVELYRKIGIPEDFRNAGVDKKDVPAIARRSMGSSMAKNPVQVTEEDCIRLLDGLV